MPNTQNISVSSYEVRKYIHMDIVQGPLVQNNHIVSTVDVKFSKILFSKTLPFLAEKYLWSFCTATAPYIFFRKKWQCFCAKAALIFSAKNISTFDFICTRIFRESLTNDFVKFTML